ncbi:MAG: hypothetical protein GF364_21780, partial [Candidatus Lokiarchaeota archaeon]|nr:hypothetical protein [Candidatus Lokiarchaeota archaeon]
MIKITITNISFKANWIDPSRLGPIILKKEGEVFRLSGQNRAGKSTALRGMAFLLGYRPPEGKSNIDYILVEQFNNIRNNLEMSLILDVGKNLVEIDYKPIDNFKFKLNGKRITDVKKQELILHNLVDIHFVDRSARGFSQSLFNFIITIIEGSRQIYNESLSVFESIQRDSKEYR